MGFIETTIDLAKGLTIITGSGVLNASEMTAWILEFYAGKVTQLVLWDLTQADLSGMSAADLRSIARQVREKADVRRDGKTALLAGRDFGYGLGRMFVAYSEIENMPLEFQVFRNIDEARKWLGV